VILAFSSGVYNYHNPNWRETPTVAGFFANAYNHWIDSDNSYRF
jgi:hypothetical protein